MNKEIAARWTAALRSGEYEQGKGYLNAGGNFCCLGVLCDLAVKEDVAITRTNRIDGIAYYGPTVGLESDAALLPQVVKEWAGMRTIDGQYSDYLMALSALNDSGASFAKIADVIDQYVGAL